MLESVLAPSSIAVIGASRAENTIGWQILDNLLRHGYTGAVYPVNPQARTVHSIRAYASVEEIPDAVEMAVIAVPKQHVCATAEACGRKGVKALVVISAGFKEVRGEGVAREEALKQVAARYGMRLVGPNCMGVLYTAPGIILRPHSARTAGTAGAGTIRMARSIGSSISVTLA
jgi:acyl-CoA synthetase (NDP forming)